MRSPDWEYLSRCHRAIFASASGSWKNILLEIKVVIRTMDRWLEGLCLRLFKPCISGHWWRDARVCAWLQLWSGHLWTDFHLCRELQRNDLCGLRRIKTSFFLQGEECTKKELQLVKVIKSEANFPAKVALASSGDATVQSPKPLTVVKSQPAVTTKQESPVVNCKVCKKTFKRRKDLYTHSLTHNPERWNFACDLCDERFINSRKLRTHQVKNEDVQKMLQAFIAVVSLLLGQSPRAAHSLPRVS